jgi:hypothetical protein
MCKGQSIPQGTAKPRGRDRGWRGAACGVAFQIRHRPQLPADMQCPRRGLDLKGFTVCACESDKHLCISWPARQEVGGSTSQHLGKQSSLLWKPSPQGNASAAEHWSTSRIGSPYPQPLSQASRVDCLPRCVAHTLSLDTPKKAQPQK